MQTELPRLSLVIPVFNGAATVPCLVKELAHVFRNVPHETILVNDGSTDETEQICLGLAVTPNIMFVQLTHNFGEFGAVMAGLRHSRGTHVVVLDDDGQNPPEEALRLYQSILGTGFEVVYGRYRTKHHSWIIRSS